MGELYEKVFDRINRCIPILGIAFWYYQYPKRLDFGKEEDVAYREIMLTLDKEDPKYVEHSEAQERFVMKAEMLAQVLSTTSAVWTYFQGTLDFDSIALLTALAALADLSLGRWARWYFNRNSDKES